MNNISTNLPKCPDCDQDKWGVTMDSEGLLAEYCIVCSGDYAHTKEARDAASGLNNTSVE
jgi:hypothetical protein